MASSTMLAKLKDRSCVAWPEVRRISITSAATLMDAVNFYDTGFDLHLSEQEDDLVAFLRTLSRCEFRVSK